MSCSARSAVSAATRGIAWAKNASRSPGSRRSTCGREVLDAAVAVEDVGREHDVAPVGDPLAHLGDPGPQADGVHEEQHAGVRRRRPPPGGRRRPRPHCRRPSGSRWPPRRVSSASELGQVPAGDPPGHAVRRVGVADVGHDLAAAGHLAQHAEGRHALAPELLACLGVERGQRLGVARAQGRARCARRRTPRPGAGDPAPSRPGGRSRRPSRPAWSGSCDSSSEAAA